jgi:hypothetical protein
VEGLKTVSSELKDKLNLYLKLFIILYVEDTVIMTESAADLQISWIPLVITVISGD